MTITQLPFWYRLVEHCINSAYVDNGLTIPFIIGGPSVESRPPISENEIVSLLTAIQSSSLPKIAHLFKCDNTAYILALKDKEIEKSLKNEIVFRNSKGEISLFIGNNARGLGQTIDEISKNLFNGYADTINNRFSWKGDDKVWRALNDREKKLFQFSND